MRRFTFPLFILLLSLPTLAAAQEPAFKDMSFDRADGDREVWRLSDAVATQDGPEAKEPKLVYLQFGFVGCVPCEALAAQAAETLAGKAEFIYVHLDDVLLDAGLRPRQVWAQLYELSQREPYLKFTVLRRGSTLLMQSMTGSDDAQPPSALLIAPSGEVLEVLLTPTVEDAKKRMTAAVAGE
ncbi:MAG: hypothetical protein CO108_14100 [Deltaproteobacteria bacterium CG_4_9_14_3_um_filter_63_12]|nr:MAG: hypothetical protein COW42_07555 [Deltaproteobacteria bacterium CG17_big_fil_post_rev_8_21_14_2_50_63_7]PJB40804.1 MAG: hypothetical protein CO108_14100 [Deltaproteobacteria bacterium CG_4_9_14_3_um_filter_63_12]